MQGQTDKNPFELKHRKKVDIPTQTASSQQDENTRKNIQKPSNPFDLVTSPIPQPTKPNTIENAVDSHGKEENQNNVGFLFWVLFTVLLVFTSIYSLSRDKINKMYNSFLNENFMRQTHRLNQGKFSFIYLLLYAFAFVNIGIFTFLSLQFFDLPIQNTIKTLFLLIMVISAILIGKHILLSTTGYIFPVNKEIGLYNFTIMVFWSLIGVILLPINIVITYAPPVVEKVTIYAAIGAIIAIYLFRAIRGISIGSKYLMSNTFHFFIYLCTVEILPVFVLLKLIQNYSSGSWL